MGGSTSKSESSSNNNSTDSVWGPQGDALKGLYDQANSLYGQGDNFDWGGMAEGLGPFMQSVMSGGQQGFNNMLGGGAYGDTSGIRNSLEESLNKSAQGGSNVGNMYESIVGGPGNTYIDPMVNAMKDGAMENNARMQAGTGANAAAMGQGGSSRHAMQNAMTNRRTNQDMLTQETNMRGNAYDKDLAMKMGIAQQADTNLGGTQDRMMQMLSGADSNVQSGMGYGSNLQNLGMGSFAPGFAAQEGNWGGMNQWANILGNPTVLNSSSGDGSSKGKGASGSMFG
jgi:hypothetical protein